jgi:hypothetical protein
MAEKISQEERYKDFPEIIKQLRIIEDSNKEIAQYQERRAKASAEEKRQIDNSIKAKKLAVLEARKELINQIELNKELTKFSKSFARYDKEVRENLTGAARGASVFSSINVEIIKEKIKQKGLANQDLEDSIEKVAHMQEQADATKEQAEAAAKAKGEAIFQNKFALKRNELEAKRRHYSEEQYKSTLANIDLEEALFKKEERILAIKEGQKELYEAAPESLRSGVDFAKKLGKALMAGSLPLVLIASLLAAALESFLELDKAAEDYRKTSGMTVKQTEHLAHQAHEIEVSLRGAGVELKHVFDVANDLANVFGDMTHFSTKTLAALSGIQARTGTTSETAAKVQGIFEQVAGVSGETAASLQMQVASLAQQGKVSPKEVLEDIAENAEATSKFFKGDVNALKAQVIQAHQLGTTLTKVAKVAEDLLDFEGGIEDELVAATYVGGQFNLSRARALAYENDLIGAQKETLKQLNQGVGFKNQDLFTQKALAKAANMSIEDINKQLLMEEKLGHLSGQELKDAEAAVSAGLDLTNINEEQLKQKTDEFIKNQQISGQITDMNNEFKGIVATVGGALMPIFSALAPIITAALTPFKWAAEAISFMIEHLETTVKIMGILAGLALIIKGAAIAKYVADLKDMVIIRGMYAMDKLRSITSQKIAISSIWAGAGPMGIFGLVLAAASIASMFADFGKAGDIMSPAKGDGKTRVSTKEGGLFELSPNDDLVAAPGAVSKMSKGGMVVSSNSDSKYIALLGRVDTLMQKLTTGGIMAHAYMDTSKVTANVANNSNNNTRNNFAFGQG